VAVGGNAWENIVAATIAGRCLADVWRMDRDSESNRVEVNISRIRAKLHVFKMAWLIETDSDGGCRLVAKYPGSSAANEP